MGYHYKRGAGGCQTCSGSAPWVLYIQTANPRAKLKMCGAAGKNRKQVHRQYKPHNLD